jgi:excinuclease ABC subunit B
MRKAMEETRRRRDVQLIYNREHNIQPETIRKAIRDLLEVATETDGREAVAKRAESLPRDQLQLMVLQLEEEMHGAAETLEFERAAEIRDRILILRKKLEP